MTEKTLEAMNDVFADIFKGQPIIREEDLTDAQPFSMYKADGKALMRADWKVLKTSWRASTSLPNRRWKY